MTKARTLGNFVSAGNPLADGSITASDVTGLSTVATTGAYADLSGKPSLATVATSGAYADLSGKPTLATVATSGSYNDLSDKPNITATANDLSGGATGSIPYQANTGDTTMLAAGSAGKVLTMNGGVPVWADAPTPGVTSVGSIVRKSGSQLFLATPTNSLLTAGYVPSSPLRMSGTSPINLYYPRYSTYYGAWVATEVSTYMCFMSRDGINWTPLFTKPSTYSGDYPQDSSSIYVVDDSNGYIFCFGTNSVDTKISFWYKTSPAASWSAATVILSDTTNRSLWSVDFVWFGSAATSGFVVCASNSGSSFVLKIPAGTQTISTAIQSGNSNGQGMGFDWNATAGRIVVMNRATATSYYAVMYCDGADINNTWTGVTRSSCGFDPTVNASYNKVVVGPSGAVMFSTSFSSNSYYYAAAGSLGSTWSSTSAGANQILYMGHNGTSWYMAKGQPGAISSGAERFTGFFTSSDATPSSLTSAGTAPLITMDSGGNVELQGNWTQRKY